MAHGDWNVPGLDPATILTETERRQAYANWVAVHKKELNELRTKYTGSNWTDIELNQIASGEHTGAIKEINNYTRYEEYSNLWAENGKQPPLMNQHKANTTGKGSEGMIAYFDDMSKRFPTTAMYSAFLGGQNRMVDEMDELNDYLIAIGEDPMPTSREDAIEKGQLDKWEHWQSNYGGITGTLGSLEMSNLEQYNEWDEILKGQGQPAPTMEEVKALVETWGDPKNFEKTLEARGSIERTLTDAAKAFFTNIGIEPADLERAFRGDVGFQTIAKHVQAFLDMNPLIKAREGKGIENLERLRQLEQEFGTGAVLQKRFGAEDFAASFTQGELTSLSPFGLQQEGRPDITQDTLADLAFSGQTQSLQSRIEAARRRKKGAFAPAVSAGGGARAEGTGDFGATTSQLFGRN
jgi:hypothetical protein